MTQPKTLFFDAEVLEKRYPTSIGYLKALGMYYYRKIGYDKKLRGLSFLLNPAPIFN